MRHCCSFKPDDIYYLKENSIFSMRKLSIGFCPICNTPITELYEKRFDEKVFNRRYTGLSADLILKKLQNEILYSMKEVNYRKFKMKPFGWIYGINKEGKRRGNKVLKQFAADFYGNTELIKVI